MSDELNNKENKIDLKRFCEAYEKQANDRLKLIYFEKEIRVITEYIPYTAKMSYVENLVKTTNFKNEIGENGQPVRTEKYERKSAMQFMLYTMMLIDLYTTVQVIYNDDSYTLSTQYDQLKKNGLLEKVLELIPESESNEFKVLLKMYNDDVYINYATPESYWSNILERVTVIATTLLSPILEEASKAMSSLDENKIVSIIEKLGK